MLMLSRVSGTFSASSAAARMWCRVQPAGRHSSYWNSLGIKQSWAHSLPVYQGEKTQIKNYLTCKGILYPKSKHKCLLTETTREKEHELHQGSTHRSIQKETFWIWDQAMVYPILKWGSHSRERSAKYRATDANTAWRQGEEGTGQATHRTQPPPPAEVDFFLSTPSRDTGTWMLVTYLGENLQIWWVQSQPCPKELELHCWLSGTFATSSNQSRYHFLYWSVGFHRADCLGFSQGFPSHYVRLISEPIFLKSISCLNTFKKTKIKFQLICPEVAKQASKNPLFQNT